MNRILIAIDPGLSGGIAWRNGYGDAACANMPETRKDLYDFLGDFVPSHNRPTILLMEKVGKHRLGNSAQSSATFAEHVGGLRMALIARAIPTHEITATQWMKYVVPGRPRGVEPHEARARKNYIKAEMQQRYPSLKVTLKTADALGLLTYLIAHQGEY
jgi:hypothetical protein